MPNVTDSGAIEILYPTRVELLKLLDHYKEKSLFVHWWAKAGQAGVLYRINCATCGACWLELRLSPDSPPSQVIFVDESGKQRTLHLPLDPISTLGTLA